MNKKRAGLVAAWIFAASLAMLLASQAVAMVRDQVTDRPSRAAATLALETTSSTASGGTTTTRPTATTATTAAPTPTTMPTGTPTTTTPSATDLTAPTTSTTTPGADEEATFYLVGGWATVRCSGDDVMLTTYAPNLGYHVDIEAAGPADVEIKFEEAGGDHRSKLEARCSSGVLHPETDEREDD